MLLPGYIETMPQDFDHLRILLIQHCLPQRYLHNPFPLS